MDEIAPIPGLPILRSDPDEELVRLWLHNRSPHTQRAYGAAVAQLRAFLGKPLTTVTLPDLQAFADSLGGAAASKALALGAIKSLFAYGKAVGYLAFDVGKALRLPKAKDELARRILTEAQVHAMIAVARGRDKLLLRFLYATGARVSEACRACWRDVQERDDGEGQVTIFGKGEKTRVVLLPAAIWRDLLALRGGATDDDPIFPSQKGGGHLDPSAVWRVVGKYATAAGIKSKPSPHWFRHSHATHSIERGAPLHLVSATLGHGSLAITGRYLHARPKDSSSRYLAL